MILKPISYKQILDNEGYFVALEIWQGNEHVTLTLKDETFLDGPSGESNWGTVKKTVDTLQELNKKNVLDRLYDKGYRLKEES